MQASHEVEHQQDFALNRDAVERRAGAERSRGDRPGGESLLPAASHEGQQLAGCVSKIVCLDPMRGQFCLGCKCGIGVDLETDRLVSRQVGLDQGGPNAGKRIEDDPRFRQIAGQRIGNEVLRVSGDPGDPAVDGRRTVDHECRVPERTPYLSCSGLLCDIESRDGKGRLFLRPGVGTAILARRNGSIPCHFTRALPDDSAVRPHPAPPHLGMPQYSGIGPDYRGLPGEVSTRSRLLGASKEALRPSGGLPGFSAARRRHISVRRRY